MHLHWHDRSIYFSLVYSGNYTIAECTKDTYGTIKTILFSSVAVFLLTSIIMWTIGFICGQQCKPRATHIRARACQSNDSQYQDATLNEPVYADPQEKGPKMIDNAAYASIMIRVAHQRS